MSTRPPLAERDEPLPVCAAVAEGEVARRLGRRMLALPDAALGRLHGVAGAGLIVVLGASEELPWADGVRYLGVDPDAPGLLVPTAQRFGWPVTLVERALLVAAPGGGGPFAVLLDPLRLVPLGRARAIERAILAAWLEAAP